MMFFLNQNGSNKRRKKLLVILIVLGLSALSIVVWTVHEGSNSRYLSAAIANNNNDNHHVRNTTATSVENRLTRISKNFFWKSLEERKRTRLSASSSIVQGPVNDTIWGAREFVLSRRKAYRLERRPVIDPITNTIHNIISIGNQWKLRGHGYLYTRHNLILAAEAFGPQATSPQLTTGGIGVKIWNVHPLTINSFQQCHLLTIWVRVSGPEIFSGSAIPVSTSSQSSGRRRRSRNNSQQQGGSGSGGCHWEFPLDHHLPPGNYDIDVKVLFWNGNAPIQFYKPHDNPTNTRRPAPEETVCPDTTIHQPDVPQSVIQKSPHPYNAGFIGFKLYTPAMACCEICRRTLGCIYWKTPPTNFTSTFPQNGCQLYYNPSLIEAEDIPQSQRLAEATTTGITTSTTQQQSQRHLQRRRRRLERRRFLKGNTLEAYGSPFSNNLTVMDKDDEEDVAYFVGCGWSFHFTLDFPCLSGDLDDHVYMVNRTFTVVDTTSDTDTTNQRNADAAAANNNDGRDDNSVATATTTTTQQEQETLRLPKCQLQDEILGAAGGGAGGGRWVREEWPSNNNTTAVVCPKEYTIDTKASQMFPVTAFDPENHPHCWHRDDDLTLHSSKCIEANCRLLNPSFKWRSSTLSYYRDGDHDDHDTNTRNMKQKKKKWMGVWRRYNCNYVEFTNQELQQCINQRKISSITMKGASIATAAGEYLKARLANINLYNQTRHDDDNHEGDGGASPSPPSSLAVVVDSLQWPHMIWRKTEQTWKEELSLLPHLKDNNEEEHYVLGTFYASSEREPYVQVLRGERFTKLAERILIPKGYKMINALDLSAAFTYDTAGQGDGLHILGPPMKMAWTKIFHYMCSDLVSGSIV